MTTKICTYCHREYTAKKSDQKFCSPECRRLSYVELSGEKIREYNRVRMREKRKNYTPEQKRAELIRVLEWKEKHPERIKELKKERKRIQNNMKDRGETGVKNILTPKVWAKTLEHFGNACAYCGSTEQPLEKDHFIPFQARGRLTIDNTVPACKGCNRDKHYDMPYDWLSRRDGGIDIYNKIQEYLSSLV